MQAAHQIKQLKRQLGAQEERQEERVQNLKIVRMTCSSADSSHEHVPLQLLRDVLKAQIGDHLRYHVHLIIQEKVSKQLSRRHCSGHSLITF